MKSKKIMYLTIIFIFMLTLSSCGKFYCDICGEEKNGKKHIENIFGEEVIICDECYKELSLAIE